MRHRGFLGVGLAAALGGCVALLALGSLPGALPASTLLPAALAPELELAGRVWRGGVPLESWLAEQALRLAAESVYLGFPEGTEEVTWAELGVQLDISAALQQALGQIETHSAFTRLRQSSDPTHVTENLAASFVFDETRARAYLERLGAGLRRDPEAARLDLRQHTRTPARPGRELDVSATLAHLQANIALRPLTLALAFRTLLPRAVPDAFAGVDVASVLSVYETDFRGKAGARAVNIARAAKFLNGTLLAPGATFSFNRTVGPRTLARGFVDAPVIVNDELEAGVGGGVCQVATTLHAAAIYGALEVLERRSHSRPSGYAPLGLDATVIDGELDLKFKNPYPQTLLIHAFLPTKTSIRVEFLGSEPPGEVSHEAAVTKRSDFVRRVTTRAELTETKPLRRQRGHYGYDVSSVVKIRFPDGRREARRFFSKYYPVPEVYWVKPGYDLNQLPELPEGATGTDFNDTATVPEQLPAAPTNAASLAAPRAPG